MRASARVVVWLALVMVTGSREPGVGNRPHFAITVAAQTNPATVEADPIKCWWQTSKGAITVGEAFELSITCAVLENPTVQVVPDESRLAVASIQLQPFEILGGSHPADTRAGGRRFLQYHYTLRLIDPSAFGADVKIPPQQIHYRVQTQVAADAALQGRDLVYILPAIPVRVLAQVPREAVDIRDGTRGLLERASALRTRAGLLDIVSIALIAIGVVLALAALIRALGGARAKTTAEAGRVPDGVVLRAAADELAEVQRRSQIEGWTPELLQRGLSSVRIVAAGANGHRMSQRPSAGPADHRLVVTHGWWKKKTVSVSSAATTGEGAVGEALSKLTAAAYGQDQKPDRAPLDDAVAGALDAARKLVRERTGAAVWVRTRIAELRG